MSDQPAVACRPVPGAHLRSLSVGAAFFDSLGFQAGTVAGSDGSAQERKGHNRRNGSMSPFDGESTPLLSDYAKKAMTTADKLAELALIDPKRAKRRVRFSLSQFLCPFFVPHKKCPFFAFHAV